MTLTAFDKKAIFRGIPGPVLPVTPRGRYLLLLCLASLGVVCGDIGTSPLYAMRECFHGAHSVAPTPANILGVLSLIFWSLIIVISTKYLAVVMRADNRGEGGILALMSLVRPKRMPTKRIGAFAALGLFGAALLRRSRNSSFPNSSSNHKKQPTSWDGNLSLPHRVRVWRSGAKDYLPGCPETHSAQPTSLISHRTVSSNWARKWSSRTKICKGLLQICNHLVTYLCFPKGPTIVFRRPEGGRQRAAKSPWRAPHRSIPWSRGAFRRVP